MFQWTTYTEKPETVPPVNRVPIGESQYVRSVTRRRRRPGGLAGFPALSKSRNFVPLPPQPYVDPGVESIYPPQTIPLPPVNYAGVITGDKRGLGTPTLLGPPDYGGCRDDGQGHIVCADPVWIPGNKKKGWNPHPMPVDVVGPPLPVTPDPSAAVTPATDSTTGSLGGFLSGIPTTYLLLGAVGLYFFMKKK